jgi:hypothetical protein
MRFNAYDELFSIRKLEEESLQSLINRVETAKRSIKELRPSTFTLDMLDDELASHRFLDLYHYLPLLEVSVLQPASPLHGTSPSRKASYARERPLAHLRSVCEHYQ